MRKVSLFIFLIFISIIYCFSQSHSNTTSYEEGKVVVKLLPQFRSKATDKNLDIPAIHQLLKNSKELNISKKFPKHAPINTKMAKSDKMVDLSLIYELRFDKAIDAAQIAKKLMGTAMFEYAEPLFIQQLAFTPTDTLQHMQYYLNNIQVYNAWNISKGDSNIVIGIVDTGVDTDHPDIVGNYAYNYNDPINGLDDDNDSYVDNFLGWDVAMNDNNANLTHSAHGINVAGISSASTDNTSGIAGVGFNCKILPVKIEDDASGRLVGAYEGVVYAADHGADVINISWGSYGSSSLGQDIVNYASFNKSVLLVGAVGNDQRDQKFYPAAYENVLSVGATQERDSIKNNSNYGHWVKVFAPGEAMYTLNAFGEYQYNGGTSMAAPVVSAVAALVKSVFPNYSPHQIAQQIITTSDNIDSLNDASLKGKLGTGRVNAHRALTESFSPGIEMSTVSVEDHNDSVFFSGDTLFIRAEFTNYLSAANNVRVNLSANHQYFEFLSSNVTLGNLGNMQSKNNFSMPFMLRLKDGLPFNEETELEFTIEADNYSTKEYVYIKFNPDYLNITKNELGISLTSRGKIGYNDISNQEGIGFRYKSSESILYESSFMIGDSEFRLADAFRSTNSEVDEDFNLIKQIKEVPAQKADYEYRCTFDDSGLDQSMNIVINQKNYIFTSSELDNQIFFVYHVQNNGNADINNLYAGIIADWDIVDFSKNKTAYNAQRKMSISYATDSSLYVGIKLLSAQAANSYAIDNANNGNGGVNILDGFSDAEKYEVLSTWRDSAGNISPNGNDILSSLSAGPLELKKDSAVVISFVLLAADNLNELNLSADKAQSEYERLSLGEFDIFNDISNMDLIISPIPAQEQIHIQFSLKQKQTCSVRVYDSQGKLIRKENYGELGASDYEKNISLHSFRSGVYFLELNVGNKKIRDKFVVIK